MLEHPAPLGEPFNLPPGLLVAGEVDELGVREDHSTTSSIDEGWCGRNPVLLGILFMAHLLVAFN